MESRVKLIKLKRANSFSLLIFSISLISLLSSCKKGAIVFNQKHPFEAISKTNSLFIYFPVTSVLFEAISDPVIVELLNKIPAFSNTRSILETINTVESESFKDAAYVFQGISPGNLGGTLILNGLSINSFSFKRLGWKQKSTSQFRGQQIVQVQTADGLLFTISTFNNLTLIAEFAYQIEDAIVQLTDQKASVMQSVIFRDLQEGSREHWASVFINPSFAGDFLSNFFQDETIQSSNQWSKVLSWCRLDLGKDETIRGKFNFKTPYDILFSDLSSTEPLLSILGVIPSTISYLEHHKVNWRHYAETYPGITPWFSNYFLPWISDSYTFIKSSSGRTDGEMEEFMVLRQRSETLKEEKLDQFLNETGLLQTFEYQTYQIKQAIHKDILAPFFVNTNRPLKNPYLVSIEDYVVFADSKAAIELWIDQYIVGNTLNNTPKFLNAMPVSSKALEQFYYVDTKELDLMLGSWLQSGENDFFTSINTLLKSLDQLAIDIKEDGHFNLYRTRSIVKEEQHRIFWKCQMEAEAAIAPKLVSFDAGETRTTIIQDKSNILYAIDAGGQIIWTKVLDGLVLSDFFPIDYYEDSDTKLLFNTRKTIYLTDKEGKDVGPFPIGLLSRASNGLQVVDFYETGAFTFFLGSENGNVYGFDKNGRPFPGWNPMREVGRIKDPILHFQFQQKDYLALYTSDQKLKVFKQDGTYRFPPIQLEKPLIAAPSFQVAEGTARIVLCHPDASATIIPPKGNHFSLSFEGRKNVDAFVFQDIIGDKRYDYLVLDNTTLALHFYQENTFKRGWKVELPNPVDELFVISKSSSSKQVYIGLLDQRRQQINLLDALGTIQSGFPLAGSTAFELYDLGGEGSKALVVGYGEEVYCYQIAKSSAK